MANVPFNVVIREDRHVCEEDHVATVVRDNSFVTGPLHNDPAIAIETVAISLVDMRFPIGIH